MPTTAGQDRSIRDDPYSARLLHEYGNGAAYAVRSARPGCGHAFAVAGDPDRRGYHVYLPRDPARRATCSCRARRACWHIAAARERRLLDHLAAIVARRYAARPLAALVAEDRRLRPLASRPARRDLAARYGALGDAIRAALGPVEDVTAAA